MTDGPETTPGPPSERGAGGQRGTAGRHGTGEQGGTGGRQGTATATRTDGPVTVSPSAYRRLMAGLPGYIVAMLSCLAVVGLVMLITPRRNPGAIQRVDYSSDLSALMRVAPYTVLAPEGLGPRWYPTSSRLTGEKSGQIGWHLGFYTPGKQYAALEESNEDPDGASGFVARMTSQGRPDGTLQVAGETWQKTFRKDKKQRSLVRRLPNVTLVITGTAGYGELAVLAGSLRPQPKPSPAASAH